MAVIQYLPLGLAAAALILRYIETGRSMPKNEMGAVKTPELALGNHKLASHG